MAVAQRRAVRQPAVLLDRERHRDRQPGGPGGADDADRLAGPGEREHGDQVGAGLGERLDLRRVVRGRRRPGRPPRRRRSRRRAARGSR